MRLGEELGKKSKVIIEQGSSTKDAPIILLNWHGSLESALHFSHPLHISLGISSWPAIEPLPV